MPNFRMSKLFSVGPVVPSREIDVVIAPVGLRIEQAWTDLFSAAVVGDRGLSVQRVIYGSPHPLPEPGTRWWRDGERKDGLASLYREAPSV